MSCLPALKTCILPLVGSIMNLAAYVTRRTVPASVCKPLKIATTTAHWSKPKALCVSTSLEPAIAGTTSVPTGSSTARSPRAETTPLGRSLKTIHHMADVWSGVSGSASLPLEWRLSSTGTWDDWTLRGSKISFQPNHRETSSSC